jgi:hypothetical protein
VYCFTLKARKPLTLCEASASTTNEAASCAADKTRSTLLFPVSVNADGSRME